MNAEDPSESSVAKGTEYEKFTKSVYETVLKADGVENISVQHNVSLKGKSGCDHQIDVFWEFKLAGQIYRTAIECKAFNQNVSIGRVRDFYGVLVDIPNLNGIFVTLVGYQSGAKTYSDHYGIALKELRRPNAADWAGRIKDIKVNFHIIDTDIEEFAPVFGQSFLATYQGPAGIALAINTGEPLIFDAAGQPVANYEQLRQRLPTAGAPFSGREHIFTFPGHKLKSGTNSYEIDAIRVKYGVKVHTDKIEIWGEQLAQAIIKDVKSGTYTFVDTRGHARQARSSGGGK